MIKYDLKTILKKMKVLKRSSAVLELKLSALEYCLEQFDETTGEEMYAFSSEIIKRYSVETSMPIIKKVFEKDILTYEQKTKVLSILFLNNMDFPSDLFDTFEFLGETFIYDSYCQAIDKTLESNQSLQTMEDMMINEICNGQMLYEKYRNKISKKLFSQFLALFETDIILPEDQIICKKYFLQQYLDGYTKFKKQLTDNNISYSFALNFIIQELTDNNMEFPKELLEQVDSYQMADVLTKKS